MRSLVPLSYGGRWFRARALQIHVLPPQQPIRAELCSGNLSVIRWSNHWPAESGPPVLCAAQRSKPQNGRELGLKTRLGVVNRACFSG